MRQREAGSQSPAVKYGGEIVPVSVSMPTEAFSISPFLT